MTLVGRIFNFFFNCNRYLSCDVCSLFKDKRNNAITAIPNNVMLSGL